MIAGFGKLRHELAGIKGMADQSGPHHPLLIVNNS
jgi:hypothetical protein